MNNRNWGINILEALAKSVVDMVKFRMVAEVLCLAAALNIGPIRGFVRQLRALPEVMRNGRKYFVGAAGSYTGGH